MLLLHISLCYSRTSLASGVTLQSATKNQWTCSLCSLPHQKKATNIPPVDKNENTLEIAVARDREVKKLIEYIRQTCARSVTLSKEPGNALTRFFFLSQIDSRKQGALAPENGGRSENGGNDVLIHEDTLEIAVARDREGKKLIEHILQTCARSVSLSQEPGNALTRFFFLSQIDLLFASKASQRNPPPSTMTVMCTNR